jgi:hypothetical protein
MPTSREMLELKKGAKIRVKSGKSGTADVVLQERPWLSPEGKPGPHRVRLWVFDKSRMPETTDECWDQMVAMDSKALYEVGGDKVVEILG